MENGVYQKPYVFRNTEYYSLHDLFKEFVRSTENIQLAKQCLLDGSLIKWLIENQDFTTSSKIMNEINQNSNNVDVLITRVIYSFLPNEPFFLKGDKILDTIRKELLGSVENFKLTNSFLNGKMISLYKAYFDVTAETIDSFEFLLSIYNKQLSILDKQDRVIYLRKNINMPASHIKRKQAKKTKYKFTKKSIIKITILLVFLTAIPAGIYFILKAKAVSAQIQNEENKFDLLSEAVNFGSIQKVSMLIKDGCNINAKNRAGNTILASSWHADTKMIRYLLDSGFDVNSRNANGNTLLMNSIDELDKVQLVVGRGANINAKNNDGETAIMKSKGAVFNYLLSQGANVNAKDNRGNTVLMRFASSSKDIIKTLVEHGADINAKNNDGLTVLMLEVASPNEDPNLEKINYLISQGAHINTISNSGKSVLDMAAPVPELTKLLLDNGAISNKLFKQRVVKNSQMKRIQTSTQTPATISNSIESVTQAIKEEMNIAYKNSNPPGTVETLTLTSTNGKDYTGKGEINFSGEIQKVTVEVIFSKGKYNWKTY